MLVDSDADRLVGVVLGDTYRLIGRIGSGGMGAVYEAHHLRLQRRVAVKVMTHVRNISREEALARFEREAVIVSRLGHPHLVNVLDFGMSGDGQPYLVMEFLEGEDLDRRIQRMGSVPLPQAVRITRQIAAAVATVHAKGIVHRDLKPANVFLVQVPGEPDFVKVLDFGMSKARAAGAKLTLDSTAVGTPAYMSPEQVSGPSDLVDHRTDQWALACIVWEMLAGHAPFSGDDPNAIFYQLTHSPPPPITEYVANLPAPVEPVLLRALSKRPGDRYPSIRVFARALESAAIGSWAEITLLQSDPTTAVAWSDLTKLKIAVAIRPLLAGMDHLRTRFSAFIARRWQKIPAVAREKRHVGGMKRAALAAAAAAFGCATAGLILASHHQAARASRPVSSASAAPAPAAGRPPVTLLPVAPGRVGDATADPSPPTPRPGPDKPVLARSSSSALDGVALPRSGGRAADASTTSAGEKAAKPVRTPGRRGSRASRRVQQLRLEDF